MVQVSYREEYVSICTTMLPSGLTVSDGHGMIHHIYRLKSGWHEKQFEIKLIKEIIRPLWMQLPIHTDH